MSDLGTDFARPYPAGDLTADMLFRADASGMKFGYLESIVEGLSSDRGAFWYDADRGLNIAQYLSDDEDPRVAEHEITQECLKDERTAKCVTTIGEAGTTWNISIVLTDDTGKTYDLVFQVSADKVSLLTAGPSR